MPKKPPRNARKSTEKAAEKPTEERRRRTRRGDRAPESVRGQAILEVAGSPGPASGPSLPVLAEPVRLLPATPAEEAPFPPELLEKAGEAVAGAFAGSTKRAYEFEWRRFTAWCARMGRIPLPASPETVQQFVLWLDSEETFTPDKKKRLKPPSIKRALAALSTAHGLRDQPSPVSNQVVMRTLEKVMRDQGVRPTKKRAIRAAHFETAIRFIPRDLRGLRDRAILLMGFNGAFRRSELAALDVHDLRPQGDEGYVVLVERSKTDQHGKGKLKGIPRMPDDPETCPAGALEAWLEAAGVTEGPVFLEIDVWGNLKDKRMSDQAVARAVKRFVRRAKSSGVDIGDFDIDDVAGHSLRRGFITDAIEAGVPDTVIMEQSGHRDHKTFSGYKEEMNLLDEKSAARRVWEILKKRQVSE